MENSNTAPPTGVLPSANGNLPNRRIVFGLYLILAALFTSPLHAGSIIGTIGFNIDGIPPAPLGNAVTLTNVSTNNSATGDWTAYKNVLAMDALNIGVYDSSGQSFSFSNSGFGSFLGTVSSDTLDASSTPIHVRHLTISGFFTPGTTLNAGGYTNQVAAIFSIVMIGYPGGSRSDSAVMATVPEPATLAILSLGSATLFGVARRRRSTATR